MERMQEKNYFKQTETKTERTTETYSKPDKTQQLKCYACCSQEH